MELTLSPKELPNFMNSLVEMMVVPLAWLLVAVHVWCLWYMCMLIDVLISSEEDELLHRLVDMVLDMVQSEAPDTGSADTSTSQDTERSCEDDSGNSVAIVELCGEMNVGPQHPVAIGSHNFPEMPRHVESNMQSSLPSTQKAPVLQKTTAKKTSSSPVQEMPIAGRAHNVIWQQEQLIIDETIPLSFEPQRLDEEDRSQQ